MNEEAKALTAVQTESDWQRSMAIYDVRVRLPGYNIMPSVNSAHSNADAARILRKVMPALTVTEHKALAGIHLDMAARDLTSWSTIVNLAVFETFGRRYEISDYKISGIAREEFSNERKEQLRLLIHAATKHNHAARAHDTLARRGLGLRPQTAANPRQDLTVTH